MTTIDAGDIFLLVASVCVVLLTMLMGMVAYALFSAAREVRMLANLFRHEAKFFFEHGHRLMERSRFVPKWAITLLRDIIHNR